MGALGKWSQHEIDKIFLLKFGQGMSEPQITDFIAKDNPFHRDIKVTGVRYVLRCKQPSPGVPNDPKRVQAKPAKIRFGSQFGIFKNAMPVPVPFDIQEGIMSQKRLQEQFLNRQKRLSKSPQLASHQLQQDPLSCQLAPPLASFQALHQQLHDDKGATSLLNYENLDGLDYAAKDFLSSLPPGVTAETQDTWNYYPGTPENIPQDSNVYLPTRKSSADSHLHSFHGTREDDPFSTINGMNSNTNTQLLTPKRSQDIFLTTDVVNPSTDTCISNLTFNNEPIDDIFKEFSSIEQAETHSMSGILDPSFDQKLWEAPFKVYGQENEDNNFPNISNPNTYLEDIQIEKQHGNTCHPTAPIHTGEYTNSLKRPAEKKRPAECHQKQKKLASHNFEACSTNGNRFGGIRGSPLDNPEIMGENPISYLNHVFDSSHGDENSSNNTGLLTSDMQPNDFSKNNKIPMDLNASTINLHNPEFHQPFTLPADTQFWTINRTEESNLTLYRSTPTGQVTINMFNPTFHSGCFINETLIPPNCSQEQPDSLCAKSLLELTNVDFL